MHNSLSQRPDRGGENGAGGLSQVWVQEPRNQECLWLMSKGGEGGRLSSGSEHALHPPRSAFLVFQASADTGPTSL